MGEKKKSKEPPPEPSPLELLNKLEEELDRTAIEMDEWKIETNYFGEADAEREAPISETTITRNGVSITADTDHMFETLGGVSDGAGLGFEFFTGLFGGDVQTDAPDDEDDEDDDEGDSEPPPVAASDSNTH